MHKFCTKALFTLLFHALNQQVNATSDCCMISVVTATGKEILSGQSFLEVFWNLKFWMLFSHILFFSVFIIMIMMVIIYWRKRIRLNKKMVHFIQTVNDFQKSLELIKGPLEEIVKEENINEIQKIKLNVAIWGTNSIQNIVTQLIEQEKSNKYFLNILNTNAGRHMNLKEEIFSKTIPYQKQKVTMDLSKSAAIISKDNQKDQAFMEKIIGILKIKIEDPKFTIDTLCQEVGMSRSSFYHKIKDITALAPADFIRIYRLECAKELLEMHQYTISEVAYRTGFSDVKYFRSVFKKQYKSTPGKYAKE